MKPKEEKARLAAVILAAGKGTRMNSDMAKVLHPVCGKPMVFFPLAAARALGAEKIILVIGHQANQVKSVIGSDRVFYAYQQEQMGTGHAVLQAREQLHDFQGTVLILCGDVPLLKPSTLLAFLDEHRRTEADITVLTAILPNPAGYGRVVKDGSGQVLNIAEEKDADEEEKRITEINTGIYCVEKDFLFDALESITTDNAQREYYLTDIVAIASEKKLIARSSLLADYHEAMGINTQTQLEEANRIMGRRLDI